MDFVNYEIVIDDRENRVIPFFELLKEKGTFSFPFTVKRVTVGDYSIFYKNKLLFVIERKTWKDLASSIKDGRSHNSSKLINVRKETECKIIYLIEGTPFMKDTTKISRMPFKCLQARLDHLMFRDGIYVVHSKNQKDTAKRINQLLQNYISVKPSLLDIEGGEHKELINKKIEITPESIVYKIWCCVPYITEVTASIFIKQGYHISDLILKRIPKEEIYAMTYPSGAIIGKRADKIYKITNLTDIKTQKTFKKMIMSVNGVSKSSASVLYSSINFTDLLNGIIEVSTIASIQKTPSRKIGKITATRIINYFTK
jgi:ERCC4-type nuclease